MWTSVLLPLLAAFGGAAPQDPARARPERPKAAAALDPEFKALTLKYGAAIADYDDQRVRMTREQRKEPEPPHPARRFLPEYLALAEKGSGGAQGWILANLTTAADDPAERVRIAKEVFSRLVESHADEDSAMYAIDGLKRLSTDLGEETTMEMAQSLEQKTSNAEVKGQVLLLRAWVRTQGRTTQDRERLEDATAIYQEILYTLPRTRAGREVSGILIGAVENEFYRREREWVDALLDLQAKGQPPSSWPPQPMHDLALQYQPIALAKNHTAQQWVNRLYPAFQQVERQGPGIAYSWLAYQFGEYYSDGPDGAWNALRCDLFTVLYRQFPTDRWVYDSLYKLWPVAEYMPLAHLEPGMQALLEKNQEPRVRAAAMFVVAQCVKRAGDPKSYQRSIELFTRIRDEFPEDVLRQHAEGGRAELAACMPGQPAPSAPAPDAEGRTFSVADYRGRALMLDFWSFDTPGCMEVVPLRAALQKKLADKPFSLVGVNVDGARPGEYHDRAAKAGVVWRSALVDRFHPVLNGWWVRRYPMTVLIDKDGIIRGRDLPWEEMVELAERLADEAAAAAEKGPPK